jgi:error-prone DNA polymerase
MVIADYNPKPPTKFLSLRIKNKARGPETACPSSVLTEVGSTSCHLRKILLIEGKLQNQENVVSVKADVVRPLEISEMDARSHDFH